MNHKDEIFLQQEPNDHSITPQQVQPFHKTQSDQIGQYFEHSHELRKDEHDSAPLTKPNAKQEVFSPEQNSEHPTRGKREKSLFHNFQKHLVITLKKLVKIKCNPDHPITSKIAQEMWIIFLKSHLYTKTILHILFGAQQQQQECSFTSAMLNRFGYVDLFNKYSQDLVKQSQGYLRRQTVKAITKVNVKQYLGRRRLSKAQQFEDYLHEFVQELSQGPIKRRIPKQKKKHLKAYIKEHSKQVKHSLSELIHQVKQQFSG